MNSNNESRRKFVGKLAVGATAGLAFMAQPFSASSLDSRTLQPNPNLSQIGNEMDKALKALGKKSHPVAYDVSAANAWGMIWSNIYFLTNEQTGTKSADLGVLNVFRHHGMLFGLNDATIKKYKLGEFFGHNDPITKKPMLRNPYYKAEDGVFPLPGLAGIKALSAKGAQFCICDMARKVYAQFVAEKVGSSTEKVYEDFVNGTLPEVKAAPSGVWVLGRLAENGIAYIDASVG